MAESEPDIQELRRRLATAEARLEAVAKAPMPPTSGFASLEGTSMTPEWAAKVVDALGDGVALVEGGVIAAANKRLATLLGERSGADLVGRPLAALREQSGPVLERWLRTDGSTVQVEVLRSLVELDGVALTLVVARDVGAVAGVETQLRQAERLAAVGTLAAGVAHQINNPLAYVITNLSHLSDAMPSLLRDLSASRVSEVEAQLLEHSQALLEAREGAERVAAIVRDLKLLSRVDDERRAPIDVDKLLDAAANLVASEFGGRVKLSRDYRGIGAVIGNESRLGQVFVNLLMNAAQALRDAGDGPHEVRLVTRNDSHGRLLIEISDTGPGIPPHFAERIFDPFFTTRPIGVGIGLGLTTSLGILDAMGGTISVDSEVGSGATFRVVLPVRPGSEAPPRNASQAQAPLIAPRPRVLIIDDEVTLTNSLRRALTRDIEVVVRTSGAEALELIAQDDRFDVVLCDIMMPGMNGIEVFERVRSERPELARRFVFMTGGAFTAETREFLDVVRNDRLEKPFELGALRRLIRLRAAVPT